jgi:hypothetical protein
VKGVLNVWHMVAYQRYYNSLVAVLSADARSGLNLDSFNSALERKWGPFCPSSACAANPCCRSLHCHHGKRHPCRRVPACYDSIS